MSQTSVPPHLERRMGFLRLRLGLLKLNIQFIIIIDLFIPRLRGGDCKYSIHNNNGFIHPLLVQGEV